MNQHSHVTPDPAIPWWDWACPTCHPRVYDLIMATPANPSHRPHDCPFCIATIPVTEEGRMRRHQDDSIPCRGSGLPPHIADALFQRLLDGRRRGFDPMTLPRIENNPPGPVDGELGAVVQRLAQARLRRGESLTDTAHRAGFDAGSLGLWELGASVRMDRLMVWAQAFDSVLCIGSRRVSDEDALAEILYTLRVDSGLSLTGVQTQFGVKRESVARWERGGAVRAGADYLCRYCVILGHPITLRPL